MKNLLLIFSMLFCVIAGSLNAGAQKLVAEKDVKKELWGYKTPGTDKWVVKPKYTDAMPFVTVNGVEVAFAKTGDVWEEVDTKGKKLQIFNDVKPYTESSKFIFVKKGSSDFSWGYFGTDSRPSSEGFNCSKDFKILSPDNFIANIYQQVSYGISKPKQELVMLHKDGKYYKLNVDECGSGYIASFNNGLKQIYDDKGHCIAQFEGELMFPQDITDELVKYRFPMNKRQGRPVGVFYINSKNEVIELVVDNRLSERDYKLADLGNYYVLTFGDPTSDWSAPAPIVVNREGEIIVTADSYKKFIQRHDKLIAVKKVDGFGRVLNGGVTLYTMDGKKLFDDGSYVCVFSGPEGDYFSVTTNGKVGVVNGDLEWIVPQDKYTKFEVVKDGYRFFTEDNKEVMADKHFKMDASATAANSNTARVTYKNGKWAFTKNGVAVTPWYDDYDPVTATSYSGTVSDVFGRNPKSGDEIIMVAKNGKYGLLNTKTLKEVAPCIYDKIGARVYGRIRVKKGGLCGFLDGSNFQVVVPCKYLSVDNYMERAQMSQNPFALVVIASDGGRYKIGYINKNGQMFETQYAPKNKVVIW